MSSKPRVFVSSTIHDFSDLRSAIWHYLDSLGFRVVMSELNDFSGPIDENSYDACLHSIESCDYFILLIGSRIGGWYDQNNRITITQQEYRVAYEQLKQGRIKILTFVRKSIWTVKHDRKELINLLRRDFLVRKELSEDNIDTIANHRSLFVNDADTIFRFIDEISRKDEMKYAQLSKQAFPPGNWIYAFDSYTDIITTLQIQLGIDKPISELVLINNVREELVNNIRSMFVSNKSGCRPSFHYLEFFRNKPLDPVNLDVYIGISSAECICLMEYIMSQSSFFNSFSLRYIRLILESGLLHKLDPDTQRVSFTDIGQRVAQLHMLMDKYLASLASMETIKQSIFEHCMNAKEKSNLDLIMPILHVRALTVTHDRLDSILAISRAIVQAIDGDLAALENIKTNPISFSKNITDDIENETPTLDYIEEWIKHPYSL